MKSALGLVLSLVALNGCASAPTSTATSPTPPVAPPQPPRAAAEADDDTPEPPKPSAAEAWAEQRSRAEAAAAPPPSLDVANADPLAVGEALESAATTKVELTPVRQLRRNTIQDLEEGRKIAEKAETFEEAAKNMEKRLGKPTWVENGTKHVWVVRDSTHCYRLLLGADGSIETETVVANEMKMVSALSQQNACTGVIVNGVPGMTR